MFAQAGEVVKVFQETSGTYTLAVAILIAMTLTLVMTLLIIAVIVKRFFLWTKPHAERLVNAAVTTMDSIRDNSDRNAKLLGDISAKLPTICQAKCPIEDCENYKSKKKRDQS